MQLRIDPRVDFACKLMLGSPQHPAITIHFLNSMLRPRRPVVAVEILNPLIGKDRSEEKVIVLDVLARDSLGRSFNIEMQTRLPLSFPNRLLYYNCKNYLRQLREGDNYSRLSPAISICLLDRCLFAETSDDRRWHRSFRLRCDQDFDLVLTQDFEFHIFELPKFKPSSDNIRLLPADEKWLYLFTHASDSDADELSALLNEDPYREAIGVLQMISKTPEDYQYYEDRLKFLRDEEGKLMAAKQEGEEIGLERGRQEGRQEGKLAGKIQMLQELLGDCPATDQELLALDLSQLASMLDNLQGRIRQRPI